MLKKTFFGGIALLLLAGVMIGVAFATGVFKIPEVVEITNKWGDVSQESTQVVTSITLDNPNPIGISLGGVGLEVDIDLNGVDFGTGVIDSIDLPKGLSTTELITTIDNSVIPQWWSTHVSAGETTTVRIVPKGAVSLFGKRLVIGAPSITRTITTDLLSAINSVEPQELRLGPISITIKSQVFGWAGASDDQTTIEGTLVIHNPNIIPIPVTKLGFTLTMNGVEVGNGATDGLTILSPRGDTTISLQAIIESGKLVEWWPTHINNGERTDYEIQVDAIFEVDIPLLGMRGVSIGLVNHTDSFQTNILE